MGACKCISLGFVGVSKWATVKLPNLRPLVPSSLQLCCFCFACNDIERVGTYNQLLLHTSTPRLLVFHLIAFRTVRP